jgi:hypothetical protein
MNGPLTKARHFFLTFFPFFIVLLLVYSPTIIIPYAHHDDYMFFLIDSDGHHPERAIMLGLGRVIGAWIVFWSQPLIHDISGFTAMRLLSIFFLSICMVMILRWVRPSFERFIDAFLFVCILFTLPPFEALVQWACALYIVVGLLLSVSAALCLEKSLLSDGRREKSLFGCLAFVLLSMSILTYQNAAMFFWTMLMFKVIFDENYRHSWRGIFLWCAVGFLAMDFYFLILKTVCTPYAKYLIGAYNPFHWTADYGAKLKWFIQGPLFTAANLWNIYPQQTLIWGVLGTVLLSCLVTVARSARQERFYTCLKSGLCLSGIVIGLLLLTYLPNLLNEKSASFYRTSFGLAAEVMFLWLWAIRQLLLSVSPKIRRSAFTLMLLVIFVFGAQQCFNNVWRYRVLPSRMEWDYIVEVLSKNDLRRFNRIAMFQAKSSPLDRNDEFAVFSTVFNQDIQPMVLSAFQTAGKPSSRLIDQLYYILPGQEKDLDPDTLVLDMRLPQKRYLEFIASQR